MSEPNEALSEEELESQRAEPLPSREAMSLVDAGGPPYVLPIEGPDFTIQPVAPTEE